MTTFEGELASSRPNDVALSADGTRAYTVDNAGMLCIYDTSTGALLNTIHVGDVPLGGMDISPDGSFIVAVGLEPIESYYADPWWDSVATAVTYTIDLATGEVMSYPVVLHGEQYAFYDAAVMNDGTVLVTGQIMPGWSGWAPLRSLDLATGEYIDLPGSYSQNPVVSDSADGEYALLLPSNISDAPLYMYEAGDGIVASHDLYEDDVSGFNNGVQAFNAQAGLVAQVVGHELFIYDTALQLQVNVSATHSEITGQISGMAFDPGGHYLFLLDVASDSILQLSTSDWTIVDRIAVGEDVTSSAGDFGNRLLVSPDLSFFLVVTDNGLVQIENSLAGMFFPGDDSANSIVGTVYDDEIYGGGGDDTIHGASGDDLISGGAGNDIINGGSGRDTASYADAAGAVEVSLQNAGAQNTMGAGVDTLSSIENLTGSSHGDVLIGNDLNNLLSGGSDSDRLFGHGGDDTLDGGAGVDRLYGGLGDDTYIVRDATDYAYENADEGYDTVESSVTVALRSNIEQLILTGSANIAGRGNELDNRIEGNSGANSLSGLGGDDLVYGNGGNDRLFGGEGVDRLYGGTGDDRFYVTSATNYAFENAGEGYDIVYSTVNLTLRDNLERLILQGSEDLYGRGNDLANRIDGNGGANKLFGLDGNDLLYGNAGNDVLDGGVGSDKLYGGTGDDRYVVDSSGDSVVEYAGQGYDRVDSSVSLTLRANVEMLVLSGSADLYGRGNAGDNRLIGNDGANALSGYDGNDRLDGGNGNDRLYGGTGSDALYGGAGDDYLTGEDGNDLLEGGAGRDVLIGGAGSDIFSFRDGDFAGTTASTCDRLVDFGDGDTINLGAVDANTLTDGNQAFGFIGSDAFHGVAGELRYEQISGNTYVQGDINGDGVADFWIRVDGLHSMTIGDFGL